MKFIIFVLFLCFTFMPVSIADEPSGSIYEYLEIPFNKTGPEDIANVLSEAKGIELEVSTKTLSAYAENIPEWNTLFDMHVSFLGDYQGIKRIRLTETGSYGRYTGEEFNQLISANLEKYTALQNLFIGQFGEPDAVFFRTAPFGNSYQFENGALNADEMMDVCQKESFFRAFTIWKNVSLQIDVDKTMNERAGHTTSVYVHYWPDVIALPQSILTYE